MLQIRSIIIGLALGGVPLAAHAADDQDHAAFMTLGAVSEAPRGFVEMCRSDQTFCSPVTREKQGSAALITSALRAPVAAPAIKAASDTAAPSMPVEDATAERNELTLLHRVNKLVNERVLQRTDMQIYGKAELWRRSGIDPGARGDCEDLAIEKRFELIEAGFDPKRMYFAVVYLPSAGLHTVLVARTTKGDLVLDSRTPYVERWDHTSYSWLSVQSVADPMQWHALDDRQDRVAKAERRHISHSRNQHQFLIAGSAGETVKARSDNSAS